MSPSESDLRAALQHGDDDGLGVNANAIIAQGQAIRTRRVRILSGAAAAVIVAAGAVGLAFARGDGGAVRMSPAATRAAGRTRTNDLGGRRVPEGRAARAGRSPAAERRARAARRPPFRDRSAGAASPRQRAPKARRTFSCRAAGARASSARTIRCSASRSTRSSCASTARTEQPSSGAPGRLTFTGQQATAIVASMERAGRTPNQTPCDPGATSTSQLLAFIGVTAGGNALAAGDRDGHHPGLQRPAHQRHRGALRLVAAARARRRAERSDAAEGAADHRRRASPPASSRARRSTPSRYMPRSRRGPVSGRAEAGATQTSAEVTRRPVRPGGDGQRALADLRQRVGQRRQPQREIGQRGPVGRGAAAVAVQQRRGARRGDQLLRRRRW